MAHLEKNRLFNVHCSAKGNFIYSGIEAETAEEAIRKSDRHEGQIVSQVDSEPIYSASIGTETDKWDDDSDTGTSVFDITIRGTNEAAVNQLRDAVAKIIGGMAAQFDEDLDSDGSSDYGSALNKFIDQWNLTTNSI